MTDSGIMKYSCINAHTKVLIEVEVTVKPPLVFPDSFLGAEVELVDKEVRLQHADCLGCGAVVVLVLSISNLFIIIFFNDHKYRFTFPSICRYYTCCLVSY